MTCLVYGLILGWPCTLGKIVILYKSYTIRGLSNTLYVFLGKGGTTILGGKQVMSNPMLDSDVIS